MLNFAAEIRADLTVVGPDNPLAMGIVDLFQKHGLRIWGPNRKAAQFESSKAFAQSFMDKHGIPTPRSQTFTAAAAARDSPPPSAAVAPSKPTAWPWAKASCSAIRWIRPRWPLTTCWFRLKFGPAGRQIVIQELLEGMEISLHALCDGRSTRLFPTSQDHKRIGDNDTGPNTGGMGAYSPTPFLSRRELAEVSNAILSPWSTDAAKRALIFAAFSIRVSC